MVWAHEHEDELLGATDEAAAAMVTAAAFRPVLFMAEAAHALASNKVRGTVLLISGNGVVRRVRR